MPKQDAWSGTVLGKTRALLDGANLYRRVQLRLDDGSVTRKRVNRALWKELDVGDRVVKDAGADPRRG